MWPTQIQILLAFLGAALMLYIVCGGADYGAGILELLPNRRYRAAQKHLINEAMGPVWEANHMWLIIVIVLLFVGFPSVYIAIMTSLHLPVVALLVGIVLRGAVFTFRHYDAVQGRRSQIVYTWIFGLSSLWTSLWLGIIASSLFRGKIDLETTDFYTAYVSSWVGLYPLTMGVFVSLIFSFLACIYLVGETSDPSLMLFFHRRAFYFNIAVVVAGGGVFAASYREGGTLAQDFWKNSIALSCMAAATFFFLLLWFAAEHHQALLTRLAAAAQAALILLGWYALQAPRALVTTRGAITFLAAASPDATLRQLILALSIGSLFIFPALFYLLHVFKWRSDGRIAQGQ